MRPLLFILALLMVVALSCGPDRAFDGDWGGNWASTSLDGTADDGSTELRIENGDVTGTCISIQTNATCLVSGTVAQGSSADVVYTYKGLGTFHAACGLQLRTQELTGECTTSAEGRESGHLNFDVMKLTSSCRGACP